MISALLGALLGKTLDIGDQLIEDKDKRAEYAFKTQDKVLDIMGKFATTPTIPWVDATVKLMYALSAFIIPMLRPLGAACMTAFGVYAHYKGIQIPEYLHAMLDGAFPGWGVSRHIEKARQTK